MAQIQKVKWAKKAIADYISNLGHWTLLKISFP